MKDKYIGTINYRFGKFSKLGIFLAYIFGLEHANMKDSNAARKKLKMNSIPPEWILRDIYNIIKRKILA